MGVPQLAIAAFALVLGGVANAEPPGAEKKETAPVPTGPSSHPSATSLRAAWTQFLGAGVLGSADRDAKYGGKLDVWAAIDSRDIGLWDGLTITVHPEFVYGHSINESAPVLLPPSLAMAFPSIGKEDFDLSVYGIQKIGNSSLTFGKINMLDISANTPLLGGGGLEGFQHSGLAGAPSGIIPPVIFGALLSMPVGKPTLTLGVWDPRSAINRTGFEHAFSEGVSGMVSVALPARIGGELGVHTFLLQHTTIKGLNLDDLPDLFLPPESGVVLGQEQGGTLVRYTIQQYIWHDPKNPRVGWGFFGRIGYWKDNPLPFRWGTALGFTGNPPFRTGDKFGIGYFRIALSPALRRGLEPIVKLKHEQGVEAFYTLGVGKYVRLTPNVQWIDPAFASAKNAVFVGLRAQLAFDAKAATKPTEKSETEKAAQSAR